MFFSSKWMPSGISKQATLLLQQHLAEWESDGREAYYFRTLDDIPFEDDPSPADRFSEADQLLLEHYGVTDGRAIVGHLEDGTAVVFLPESDLLKLGVKLPNWSSVGTAGLAL